MIFEEVSDSPIITTVTETSSNGDDINNNNNFIKNNTDNSYTTTKRYYQTFERSRTTPSPTISSVSTESTTEQQSQQPTTIQNDIITQTHENFLLNNIINNNRNDTVILSSKPLTNLEDTIVTTISSETETELPLTTTLRYIRDNDNDNVNSNDNNNINEENEVKKENRVSLNSLLGNRLNSINNSSRNSSPNRYNFNNNRTQYQTVNRLNNRFATSSSVVDSTTDAGANDDNDSDTILASTQRSRFRPTTRTQITETKESDVSSPSPIIKNSNTFPSSVYAPRPFARRTRPTTASTSTTAIADTSSNIENENSNSKNNSSTSSINNLKRVSYSSYSDKSTFIDSILSDNTESEGEQRQVSSSRRTTTAGPELSNDISRRRRVLARGRSRFTPDSSISETSSTSFIKSTPSPFSRSFSLSSNNNNNNNDRVTFNSNLNSIQVKSNGEPKSVEDIQSSSPVFDEASINFRPTYDSLNEEDENSADEPKIITEESLQEANRNKVQINTYSGIDDNSSEYKKPERIILTLGAALNLNGGVSQNPTFRSFVNNIDERFKGQPFSVDLSSTTLDTTTKSSATSALFDNVERGRNNNLTSTLTTNPFRGRTRPITTTTHAPAIPTEENSERDVNSSRQSNSRNPARSRSRGRPVTTTTESQFSTIFDDEEEEEIEEVVTEFRSRTRPTTTTESVISNSKVFDSTLRPLEIANELDFTRPIEDSENDEEIYTRAFTPAVSEESSTRYPFDDSTTLLPSRINDLIEDEITTNRIEGTSTVETVDVNSESSYRRRPTIRNRFVATSTPSSAENLSTTNRFTTRSRRPNSFAFQTRDQQITNVEITNNGAITTDEQIAQVPQRPRSRRPDFRQRTTSTTEANYDEFSTEDDSVVTTSRSRGRRPSNRFETSRNSQETEQRRRPITQSRVSSERNVSSNDLNDIVTEIPRRGSNRFSVTRRTTESDTETSTRSSSQLNGRRRRPSNFNRVQTKEDETNVEDQTETSQIGSRRRPDNNRLRTDQESNRGSSERPRNEYRRRPQANRFSNAQNDDEVSNNEQEAGVTAASLRRRPVNNRFNNNNNNNNQNDESVDNEDQPQTTYRRRPVSRLNTQNNNNNNGNDENQSTLVRNEVKIRPFTSRLNSSPQRPSFTRVNAGESETESYDGENQTDIPRPNTRRPSTFSRPANRFNLQNTDALISSESPQRNSGSGFRFSRRNNTRFDQNEEVIDSKDNSSELLVTKLRTRPAYLRPAANAGDDLTASQQFNAGRRPSQILKSRRVIPSSDNSNSESETSRPQIIEDNSIDENENASESYNDLEEYYSTTEYYDDSTEISTDNPIEIVSNRTAGTRYGGRKVIRKKPFNVGTLPTTAGTSTASLSTSTTEIPQYRKRKLVRINRLNNTKPITDENVSTSSTQASLENTSSVDELSNENDSTRLGIKRRKKIIRKYRPTATKNETQIEPEEEIIISQEVLKGGILEQRLNSTDTSRRGKKIFRLDTTADIDAEEYIATDDEAAQNISEEASSTTTASSIASRARTRRPGVLIRPRTSSPLNFDRSSETSTSTPLRKRIKVIKTLPTRKRNNPFRPQNRINEDAEEPQLESEVDNENEEIISGEALDIDSQTSSTQAPVRKGFVPRRPTFRTPSTTTEHPASRKYRTKSDSTLETTTSRFPGRARKIIRKFNSTTTQLNTINDTIYTKATTDSVPIPYTTIDDYNTNILMDLDTTTSITTNVDDDDDENDNINKLNTLQDSSGSKRYTTTTTQKPTTLHHVFAIDYDETASSTTSRIRTKSEEERDNAPEIVNRNEKLVEINRIVEIYSKQNKLKFSKNSSKAPVLSDQTNLVLEQVPKLDRLGEISRLTSIKLVEHEYTPNKSETLNESESVNTGYARQQKNNVNENNQLKKSRNIVFANTVFNVETSTIALEGLFNPDRESKNLAIGDDSDVTTTATPATVEEIITTTTTTTQAPNKRPKILRPPTPLLRPESNETNPLVISIANLDQVILSKINHKNTDKDGDASPSAKINTYFKNGPVYRPPNDISVITPSPSPTAAIEQSPQKQAKALDSNSNDFVRKDGTPLLKVTVINPRANGKAITLDSNTDATLTSATESNESDIMTAIS